MVAMIVIERKGEFVLTRRNNVDIICNTSNFKIVLFTYFIFV